jgi:hypothetical protein
VGQPETEIQRALRSVEHVTDPTEQWARARQIVAKRRRDAAGMGGPRTWNEWDLARDGMQPADVPAVYDLDGDVWEHGPPGNNGAWKMRDFDPDEHESAAGGMYVWASLIVQYGPITEIQ